MGELVEGVLDLARVDVEAAADDHVAGAADDREHVAVVQEAEVAGGDPTVAGRRRSRGSRPWRRGCGRRSRRPRRAAVATRRCRRCAPRPRARGGRPNPAAGARRRRPRSARRRWRRRTRSGRSCACTGTPYRSSKAMRVASGNAAVPTPTVFTGPRVRSPGADDEVVDHRRGQPERRDAVAVEDVEGELGSTTSGTAGQGRRGGSR